MGVIVKANMQKSVIHRCVTPALVIACFIVWGWMGFQILSTFHDLQMLAAYKAGHHAGQAVERISLSQPVQGSPRAHQPSGTANNPLTPQP